jgi:hypothetical protein
MPEEAFAYAKRASATNINVNRTMPQNMGASTLNSPPERLESRIQIDHMELLY